MAGKKRVVISNIQIEESPELTFEELCTACRVSAELIHAMIEEGALEPTGFTPEEWRFNAMQLRRTRVAAHLQQDLEINPPGIALALDLMEEMEELRTRIELLEKYFIER